MSKNTNIEWCDGTVNPTMGCDGCELWNGKTRICYAGIMHLRYGGRSKGYAPTFEQVTKFPGRMSEAAKWGDMRGQMRPEKPWLDGMPRTIFISDMSDLLSKAVDFDYIKQEVIDVVNSPNGRRHIWFWLTKQARRMLEFSVWLQAGGINWPMHLWPMTSITSQDRMNRIDALSQVGDETTTRGLSIEPMLTEVVLKQKEEQLRGKVHWAIYGGASGNEPAECDIGWIWNGIQECRRMGIAPFVKQLGSNAYTMIDGKKVFFKDLRSEKGGDWSEWPEPLRVREFPTHYNYETIPEDKNAKTMPLFS